MVQRHLECSIESWPLKAPFATSDNTVDKIDVVLAEIHEAGKVGRGEAAGVYFRGETVESMATEIHNSRHLIEAGVTKEELQSLLPAGGARNAIDCALWDLEAKLSGVSVATRIGVPITPVRTVATIGIDSPESMARQARLLTDFQILKLKLGPHLPLECVTSVRLARPDVRLIVDVNEGWTLEQLDEIAPKLPVLGVEMLEQPVPRSSDSQLLQSRYPLPICADESCRTREDLERLKGRYSMLNIKLDKTGGLTEALALARAAREAGFGLMTGNMLGTSLAMAPASLLAPWCRFMDLDGGWLLSRDRKSGMVLKQDLLEPPRSELWGGAHAEERRGSG